MPLLLLPKPMLCMLPVAPKMGFQPSSGDALAASALAYADPLAVRVCANWS